MLKVSNFPPTRHFVAAANYLIKIKKWNKRKIEWAHSLVVDLHIRPFRYSTQGRPLMTRNCDMLIHWKWPFLCCDYSPLCVVMERFIPCALSPFHSFCGRHVFRVGPLPQCSPVALSSADFYFTYNERINNNPHAACDVNNWPFWRPWPICIFWLMFHFWLSFFWPAAPVGEEDADSGQ